MVEAYTRTPHVVRRRVLRATTPGYRVGVLGVLRRPDGRVLLVDQPYVVGWSLPGGDLTWGESVQQGLQRELREELGLDLSVPAPVTAHQRTADRWVTFAVLLDITDEQADRARAGSPELRAIGWFDLAALPEMDPDAAAPMALVLAGS